MTNHVQTAIKSLTKQAEKLQERVTFFTLKEKDAALSRKQHEEQLDFILGQIKNLKGEKELELVQDPFGEPDPRFGTN